MLVNYILFVAAFTSSRGFEFEGVQPRRAQPLTKHKAVHCFDENFKSLGPKGFEVERHNKDEEFKSSIVRHKRRAKCIVKTRVSDDVDTGPDIRRHHDYHYPVDNRPRNFATKTSYSVSKIVTSPPMVYDFSTHHSSSSVTESSSYGSSHQTYPSIESLPEIPHLPDIPHIGHEGTYPGAEMDREAPGNDANPADGQFANEEEPGPGEKTIKFKTNTHRHEVVDQTGFVREKTNGYPIRPNEEWRSRFKDLANPNGEIMSGADVSSLLRKELLLFVLVRWLLSLVS